MSSLSEPSYSFSASPVVATHEAWSSEPPDCRHDHHVAKTIEGLAEQKYELRPGPRAYTNITLQWLDEDQSGTYDPNGKKRLTESPPPTRKRLVPEAVAGGPQATLPKKLKSNTWLSGRQEGKSLVVTLKLKSERVRALARTIPDYKPELALDSTEGSTSYEALWLASGPGLSTNDTSPFAESYHLRSKYGSGSASQRFFRPPITESEATKELTLGHPEARGCKACLELRQVCPLVSEDRTYPCYFCVEDGCECELIIEPRRKRACEGCRQRRCRCSYRDGGDHALPCEQCQKLGRKCVAGPETDRVSYGRFLNDKPALNVPTDRSFVACAPCRRAKKWCPLKDKNKSPPCKTCAINGIHCTFERLGKCIRVVDSVTAKQTADVANVTKVIRKDQNGVTRTGETRTIKTKFAHPITFNYDPPEDGSSPCHFCDQAGYGIMGIVEKRVEVIDWKGGRGYVELEGGNTCAGVEPSRMCFDCTAQRMRVFGCKAHDMQPMELLDSNGLDFSGRFHELFLKLGESTAGWCAACPATAYYKCCAPQETDMYGQPVDPRSPEASGCGLLLCNNCAWSIAYEHDGDLPSLIAAIQHDEQEHPTGLRADASFLLPEGELLRQIFGGAA
ncbi:MAG: hypothetical protein M1812_004940 [Candelaria pacifica]|nr:MAG: hypothetical protein M1812_004940 [Candelaria pacifica]